MVRGDAASVLGKLGFKEAIPYLSAALQEDKHGWVRGAAARALGLLGFQESIPYLGAALQENEQGWVRRSAAWALGRLCFKEIIPYLIAALKDDKHTDIRYAAELALRKMCIQEGALDLSAALQEAKAADVRRPATEALGKLELPLLLEAYCVQPQVREALLPFIAKKLYTERLVIEANGQLTLYEQVGSTKLGSIGEKFSEEGIQALQAALQAHREAILFESALAPARECDEQGRRAYQEKDYKKAIAYDEKGLKLKMEVYGREQHVQVAHSYNNLGCAYDRIGDDKSALACFQKAYGIWKKLLGEEHEDTKMSKRNIDLILEALAQQEAAARRRDEEARKAAAEEERKRNQCIIQ